MPVNQNAERDNPCLKESNLSYRCMSENNYDSDKCQIHFKNYNHCKEFWGKIRSMRRAKGIEPYLPNIEDRTRIKDAFLHGDGTTIS